MGFQLNTSHLSGSKKGTDSQELEGDSKTFDTGRDLYISVLKHRTVFFYFSIRKLVE